MMITIQPGIALLLYIVAILVGFLIGMLCAFSTQLQNIRLRKQYHFPNDVAKLEPKSLQTTENLEDDYEQPV